LRRWDLAYSFANNLPPDLRTAMLPWKQILSRNPRANAHAEGSPALPTLSAEMKAATISAIREALLRQQPFAN